MFREYVKEPFLKGFCSVFPQYGNDAFDKFAELFTNDEICQIFDGKQVLTEDDIKNGIIPGTGYHEFSPQIIYLKEILLNFSPQMQMKFVLFATGRFSLPKEGLVSLPDKIQVFARELTNGPPDECYPAGQTCESIVGLPRYSTREIMEKMFEKVLARYQRFGIP
jgi:hypothetical protein